MIVRSERRARSEKKACFLSPATAYLLTTCTCQSTERPLVWGASMYVHAEIERVNGLRTPVPSTQRRFRAWHDVIHANNERLQVLHVPYGILLLRASAGDPPTKGKEKLCEIATRITCISASPNSDIPPIDTNTYQIKS